MSFWGVEETTMPKSLQLHPYEAKIIERYKKHLRDVASLYLTQKQAVERLIRECGEELTVIEGELIAEGDGRDHVT